MSANTGNPVLQSYQAWSERTPYITRTSTVILVIMYITSFFVTLEDYLGNIPYFTMLKFEVYRILLSPLVGNSIFTILLVFMTYPTLGVKMEGSMGSSAFLWLLLMIGIVVNVAFNFICGLLYVVGTHEALLYGCMDFWTILFALITIDCLYQPDTPRRLLFIPYDIPSKYIPLLLYAIICLFSGFLLSYALSMVIGYLWSKGHLDRFRPSSVYLSDLEAPGGRLHYVSRASGWVLAGTLGHDAWIPVAVADPDEAGSSHQPSAPPQPRGSGGFFSGNTAGPSSAAGAPEQPKDQFPGSGRKLTAENSTTSSSAGHFLGFAVPPISAVAAPVAATASNAPSREELAARRLAVLEAQQRSQSSINSSNANNQQQVPVANAINKV